MSELCTPEFEVLAEQLGDVRCEGAAPVAYLNAPWDLTDWTMPVVEVVMIGGALLALAHAVSLLRRGGDATGLGVWLAALVYVVVLEPPLYFPAAFGIEDYVPAVFVHNTFTVGFFFERMPLYIALLYPAMVYLAWTVVRSWRVTGALRTAVCVGFVHHAFYEVFDMLGPQRSWWAWDYETPVAGPRLGSVPLSSMSNFALVMPAAFALLAVLLLTRRPRTTVRSVLLPALGVGVLTTLVSAPGQVPATLLDVAPGLPTWIPSVLMLALIAVAGVVTVREAWRARTEGDPLPSYALWHGGGYLVVMTALWLVALPQTLDPPDGVLVGSLPYVVGCIAVSGWLLSVTAAYPGRDARARSAARKPHMPWTPAPGGVDDEQSQTPGAPVA
ncbi:MAG: Uncharacterized protein JWN84_1907 [Nocardioides sp.]|nr:Uncharacterized protein [Nocardioides sp.]